jgi:Zinc carboxypeptidase
MQDFNYVVAGVMEITLEVSCCKFPPRSMLRHFWEENKEAMVEFVQAAQLGRHYLKATVEMRASAC